MLATILTLVLCAQPAQAPARPDAAYAEGTQIVRVEARSAAELDALLELADGVMSERVGVGPVELLVSPADIRAMEAMGLDREVLVGDVPAWVRAERARIDAWHAARAGKARGVFEPADEDFFSMFHPLEDMHARMAQLAAARPDLCRLEVIGQSIEGRDIYALVLTSQGDTSRRPAVVFIGTQHAREWAGTMTTMYLAERLVADFGYVADVRRMLLGVEFWIVPIANPDGYYATWNGARFWRKNTRPNDNGSFGVDLNRNWGFAWGGPGSSGSPSSDTYRGTEPFSEPETRALRDMTLALGDRIVAAIDYHSFSKLILTPWGYSTGLPPEPYASFFDTLGEDMSRAIFDTTGEAYEAGPAAGTLYRFSGGAQDWYFGDRAAAGFTIELRDDSFELPPEEILPCGRENFAAAMVFAEATAGPLPTADVTGDGVVNNTDINAFATAFLGGGLLADVTEDGVLNNADINWFVTLFLAGV